MNKIQKFIGHLGSYFQTKPTSTKTSSKLSRNYSKKLEFPRKKMKYMDQFLNEIQRHGDHFHNVGLEMGKRDISIQNLINFALAHVGNWSKFILEKITFSINTRRVELEEFKNQKAQLKTELDKHLNILKELEQLYQWNRKDFAAKEGIWYVSFAVFLILADVPLSYTFTLSAFGLEMDFTNAPIGASIALVLIIGMALLPVYFKYYFDKYLLSNPEKLVSQFLISHLPGKKESLPIEPGSRGKVRTIWYTRLSIETLIFFALLILIAILSIVRAEETNLNGSFAIPLFMLISLLLPVIGGILLSKGVIKIQNSSTLKKAQTKVRNTRKSIEKKEGKIREALSETERLNLIAKWAESKEFEDSYKAGFTARILEGYKRGLEDYPDKESLYEWANQLRNKELKLSNTKI